MFLVFMLILLLLSLLLNRTVWRKRKSIPDTTFNDERYIWDAYYFTPLKEGYVDTVECGYQEHGRVYLCKSCQKYGRYNECNANVRIIRMKTAVACKYSTSISYNPRFRFGLPIGMNQESCL